MPPAPRTPATPVRVETVGRERFPGLEKEWNELVEATCDEPFYRHEFIRAWIDSFAPGATLKVLTGRNESGRLVAALPLVADRGFFYGVPVRRLISPTSLHSARFDMIAADRRAAALAFLRSLAADGTWDIIRLTEVPAGGNAWDLYEAAAGAGFPAGIWDSHLSPFIPLPASWEALEARLSSKFKANLRRRGARLAERGDVSIECLTGEQAMRAGLQEFLALERSGWKGSNGSAAAQTPETLGFYTGLAQAAARDGSLSLTFLVCGRRRIAAQYGLTRRGRYSLMMTCYDEAFREFGPGHLLMREVLKRCIADGVMVFDFLGVDGAWKLDWKPVVRSHHWFFIFRGSLLGRTLRSAKFAWLPAAKEGFRRIRAPLFPGAEASWTKDPGQGRRSADGRPDPNVDAHLPMIWS